MNRRERGLGALPCSFDSLLSSVGSIAFQFGFSTFLYPRLFLQGRQSFRRVHP
jgi:hypothetical protein